MMAVKVVLKLIITAALILAALRSVDLSQIRIDLEEFSIFVWCASVVLLLGQFIFVRALRWNCILGSIDHRLPVIKAMTFAWISQFFNQVLPSSIGGDGMLIFLARSEGVPLKLAIHSVIIDRIIGTTALFALSALALLFALPYATDGMFLVAIVSLSTVGFLAGFNFPVIVDLAETFLPARFSEMIRQFLKSVRGIWHGRRRLLALIALCCIGHISMATAALLVAKAFGLPAPFIPMILLLPGVFLFTIIPVSFGGWGVRETGMIILLSNTGMRPSDALAISVLYGLTELAVSAVGGIFWLLLQRRSHVPSMENIQQGRSQ
ncbi:lysylphosphatidylglycerol synthase transmembrane domain-containing protein [Aliirhizobium smilacinae]|uniref:Flippase-like domain-containing protein n=1 Tax=Aliirhizobium smilacinae TaxID=1395944 RepID=A0A5C4X931_9HYPH|nr:lysylphosphatidylglycerol synthase transmembrane domain-containing protein [Rhizobium smilacinae]TNM59898.1 flippase-like domain-containing protein [Rhizobium smilacinae]